jgi:histidyl-tRNA synthetase
MKSLIQSLKGTRDFYPEEMAVRKWLYETISSVSESYGYQEYEGPFLESIELYAAKSGEELVKEQSFVFPDRGGDLITLRPELTPTLARMVAQRQHQLLYPLRWWSFGPFWRYERPQKGRTREFFQWNIDLIGIDTPEADAEMIAIAADFLKQVGLSSEDVHILINDRRLMKAQFDKFNVPPKIRPEVLRLIDRRDKLTPDNWAAYARDIGLNDAQFEGIKSTIENKDLWKESQAMVRLFAALDALGVTDYVTYAPYVIRGLDYYTGTVFETWDRQGEFRAILGGGRYDNLVGDVGGDQLPGVGFAMGDVVVSLLLEKLNAVPDDLGKTPASVLVTVFDENTLLESYKLAAELRQNGLKVACYPETTKLGKQFKYADRVGAKIAVVIGPDEMKAGLVSIKDLRTGEQQPVNREEATGTIEGMLTTTLK